MTLYVDNNKQKLFQTLVPQLVSCRGLYRAKTNFLLLSVFFDLVICCSTVGAEHPTYMPR